MKKIALVALAATLSSQAFAQVDERALKNTVPFVPNIIENPRDVQAYTGTNVGGISWDRPFADGSCCSGLGPVLLTTQAFTISTSDTCNIISVQDGGWDGFLFVYTDPFDPLNQTANFVAGNDDGNGGIGTSDIEGVALTGGTLYQIVTTGFELGEEGTFTNTITCPTALVTIGGGGPGPNPAEPPASLPTLSQTALLLLSLALGFVGLVGIRRRA